MVFTNKKRYKRNGFFYYFFWAIMIIVGSIIGVFILSSFIPTSLLNTLRGNKTELFQNKQPDQYVPSSTPEPTTPSPPMIQQENIPPATSTSPKETSRKSMTPPNLEPAPATPYYQAMPKSQLNTIQLATNAPVFVNGTITPTGEFTNNKGTRYVAGILSFTGRFPQDFQQPFYTAYTYTSNEIVSVQMAIGWNNLPSFDEISRRYAQHTNVIINLPKLIILDMKIQVLHASFSMSEQIRKQVAQYIQRLFNRQLVPQNIINMAQQRLATSYISKNYGSIQLIPLVNQ